VRYVSDARAVALSEPSEQGLLGPVSPNTAKEPSRRRAHELDVEHPDISALKRSAPFDKHTVRLIEPRRPLPAMAGTWRGGRNRPPLQAVGLAVRGRRAEATLTDGERRVPDGDRNNPRDRASVRGRGRRRVRLVRARNRVVDVARQTEQRRDAMDVRRRSCRYGEARGEREPKQKPLHVSPLIDFQLRTSNTQRRPRWIWP